MSHDLKCRISDSIWTTLQEEVSRSGHSLSIHQYVAVGFRIIIINLIDIIARPSRQYSYENDVPIANVPEELISMWDDYYHPDGEFFRSSYGQAELEELANFNAFYEERVDRLPTNRGVRGLQSSPEWQQIQERAKEILTSLDWDASSKASIPGDDVDKSSET